MTSRPPIESSLLGTAVGDALGLPYEGLTAERSRKLRGHPNRFRFLSGRGMVSDDTEHACLKLCIGFGPARSGVFSAGNGPSMQAPILGAAIDSLDVVLRLNHLSSRITHTDPVAEHGAAAVAIAAWGAARNEFPDHSTYFLLLRGRLAGEHAQQLLAAMDKVEASLATEESTQEFCLRLCGPTGATGYTLHTVPVAIHAWLRHRGQLGATLRNLILCGGDADSTAAIAGGIAGCETEVADKLADGIVDWPCNPRWINKLTEQLIRVTETGLPERPLQSSFLLQVVRNCFFLVVVLLWGLRRLLPPF
jgi:ADP-ribosyl-[dinitrogen reductase] hydrolase